MVIKSLYGEEDADELDGDIEGTEHRWGGTPLKVRMPWSSKSWNVAEAQGGVYSFGNTGVEELARHPGRGGQSFIAMPLGNLVKAIKDGNGDIRKHWSQVTGDFTQNNHRKLQDRPMVLIIDEAHLLVEPGGTDTEERDYAILYKFLVNAKYSNNVYTILLTSTPGSAPPQLARLAKIVVPRALQSACEGLERATVTPSAIRRFTGAMAGCVDFWMTLGDTSRYPDLVDANIAATEKVTRRSKSVLLSLTGRASETYDESGLLAPHVSVDDTQAYIQNTCTPGLKGAAENFAAYAGKINGVGELIGEDDLERGGAGALLTRAIEHLESRSDRVAVNKTAHKVIAAARNFALVGKDRIDMTELAAAGQASARGVNTAAIVNRTYDSPLHKLSPKLATFAHNVLEDGKQVVAIPLQSSEQKRYKITDAIKTVLETTCGLSPYSTGANADGRSYVIVNQLDRETKDRIQNVFNDGSNDDGSRIKVIVMANSSVNVAISLERVQGMHVMEWTRVTTMAQAIGRAQRVCKFLPGVELRVFTYSMCGKTNSRGSLAAEKSVARRLQVAHDQMVMTNRQNIDGQMEATSTMVRDKIDMYKSIVRQMETLTKILKDLKTRTTGSTSVPMSSIDVEIFGVLVDVRRFNDKWGEDLLKDAMDDCAPASRKVGGNINWLKANYPVDLSDALLDRALNRQDSPYVEHLGTLLEASQEELVKATSLMEKNTNILRIMDFMIKSRYRYTMGYIEPGAGIDEMIAAVYTRQFEPMRSLLRALAIASVSCDLYRDLHTECGQLAGLPGYDDLLVDLPCGDPAGVASERDIDMRSKVREDSKVGDPEQVTDEDEFIDTMIRMLELAMSDAYEICSDDSMAGLQSECSDDAVKNPKHPLFAPCREFKSCQKIKVVSDKFETLRPDEPLNYDALLKYPYWTPY
jgi:hypothetical protein